MGVLIINWSPFPASFLPLPFGNSPDCAAGCRTKLQITDLEEGPSDWKIQGFAKKLAQLLYPNLTARHFLSLHSLSSVLSELLPSNQNLSSESVMNNSWLDLKLVPHRNTCPSIILQPLVGWMHSLDWVLDLDTYSVTSLPLSSSSPYKPCPSPPGCLLDTVFGPSPVWLRSAIRASICYLSIQVPPKSAVPPKASDFLTVGNRQHLVEKESISLMRKGCCWNRLLVKKRIGREWPSSSQISEVKEKERCFLFSQMKCFCQCEQF